MSILHEVRAGVAPDADDLAAPDGVDRRIRELGRENAFLNGVLEHISDGVAACDADGTLVYFNPTLREIHGLPEHPLARDEWANAYDLYDGDGIRLLEPHEIPLARAAAGEQVQRLPMVVRNAGGIRHFLASGSPITAPHGEHLGAVITMHDVTADERRRRIRREHLAIATALSRAPEYAEGIASAVTHLRKALGLVAADFVGVHTRTDHDIDARVVAAVIRSEATVQAPLAEPFEGYVLCVPVLVAGSTHGVLYLAGDEPVLLDDLSGTTAESVATLLGRWLEQRRAAQLDRELRTVRHELARLARLVDDYVWSAEILPSGFTALRTTTSPTGVVGRPPGSFDAATVDWLSVLTRAVDPADLPAVLAWIERTKQGRPGGVLCRLRGLDGVTRQVWTEGTIRAEGERRYLDGRSRDVSGDPAFG